MKILHLWPHTKNVGDAFVQRGIVKLLSRALGDYEYTQLPCNHHGGDVNTPRGITASSLEIIDRHDLLIVGGSNLYEFVGDNWGVHVEDEALAGVKTPVILLGLGNGWSFQLPRVPQDAMSPRGLAQIRALNSKALASSVRDDMTARVLRAHGIQNAVVTGCPAAYLESSPLRAVRNGVVGVPMLPARMYAPWSRDPRDWRKLSYRRKRGITKIFKEVMAGIHARGYQTRLLVHDARDAEIARAIPATRHVDTQQPGQMLAAISECDVIVGFRLHACIAALGMGIPCIPILADGRSMGFAETFRLGELSVALEEGAAGLVLERVDLALGKGRDFWEEAIGRRRELEEVMHSFVDGALVRGGFKATA